MLLRDVYRIISLYESKKNRSIRRHKATPKKRVEVRGKTYDKTAQKSEQPEKKRVVVGGKAYKVLKTVSGYESTPLVAEEPEAVGKNKFKEWEDILTTKKYVDTPIGDVLIYPQKLTDHFQPKVNNEIGWRKTGVGYLFMTLQNPQEIWVNWGGESLGFVYVRRFRILLEEGVRDLVQIAIVETEENPKRGNKAKRILKTYFSEKNNPDSLYRKRTGYLIYKRRGGKESKLPAPSIT